MYEQLSVNKSVKCSITSEHFEKLVTHSLFPKSMSIGDQTQESYTRAATPSPVGIMGMGQRGLKREIGD